MGNQAAVAENVVRAARKACAPAPTDRELLHRHAEAGDQDAFAALARRHGAMALVVHCSWKVGWVESSRPTDA
jgi:hypothetical protein